MPINLIVFPRPRAAPLAVATLWLGALPLHADVPVVELTGVVHPVSAEYVVASIDKADTQKAPLVVLRLDTPGGLDSSMRQIIEKILNCRTPVVAFVGP